MSVSGDDKTFKKYLKQIRKKKNPTSSVKSPKHSSGSRKRLQKEFKTRLTYFGDWLKRHQAIPRSLDYAALSRTGIWLLEDAYSINLLPNPFMQHLQHCIRQHTEVCKYLDYFSKLFVQLYSTPDCLRSSQAATVALTNALSYLHGMIMRLKQWLLASTPQLNTLEGREAVLYAVQNEVFRFTYGPLMTLFLRKTFYQDASLAIKLRALENVSLSDLGVHPALCLHPSFIPESDPVSSHPPITLNQSHTSNLRGNHSPIPHSQSTPLMKSIRSGSTNNLLPPPSQARLSHVSRALSSSRLGARSSESLEPLAEPLLHQPPADEVIRAGDSDERESSFIYNPPSESYEDVDNSLYHHDRESEAEHQVQDNSFGANDISEIPNLDDSQHNIPTPERELKRDRDRDREVEQDTRSLSSRSEHFLTQVHTAPPLPSSPLPSHILTDHTSHTKHQNPLLDDCDIPSPQSAHDHDTHPHSQFPAPQPTSPPSSNSNSHSHSHSHSNTQSKQPLIRPVKDLPQYPYTPQKEQHTQSRITNQVAPPTPRGLLTPHDAERSHQRLTGSFSSSEHDFKPYAQAIQRLSSLSRLSSPHQKLSALSMLSQDICGAVDTFYGERNHISPIDVNSDNLLSIFVYVMIQSKLSFAVSEVESLEAFLGPSSRIGPVGYFLAVWNASIRLVFEFEYEGEEEEEPIERISVLSTFKPRSVSPLKNQLQSIQKKTF